MLITTQTTLALKCPICGQLGFCTLSRFALSHNQKRYYKCECGAGLAVLVKPNNSVRLQVNCTMCEKTHTLLFKPARLWNNEVKTVHCDNTGLEIGFIGPYDQVKAMVRRMDRSVWEIAEELGYDTYFVDSEIMCQALDRLNKMTEDGSLDCECGSSHLEVEVFPDRIELYCANCEAAETIFARTKEDLQHINNLKELHISANKKNCLETRHSNKRGRMARKTPK